METEARGLKRQNIDVRGGRMHYVEKGTGEPIVMVHGFADISSWRVWDANIDTLAANNRVIAVDLPGYGESTGPEGGVPTDFNEWFWVNARAVHDLIHGLDLTSVTLCGLSAGGAASLLLVTEWPDDVSRLVLVDSAGSQEADRWKSIDIPTLIIWQKEDKLLPLEEHGRKLQTSLSKSKLEVVEGNAAGIEPYDWHWPQALNPDRFNQLVADFMTRLRTKKGKHRIEMTTPEDGSIEIERRFPAGQSELWQAWTVPEELARWWWPERFQTIHHIDARPGGSYRFTTADVPPMGQLELAGVFEQVQPPRYLAYTWRWESDLGHESRVTVEFLPEGNETLIRVRHEGLRDDADRDNHVVGWNDCLDRLEALSRTM